MRNVGLFVLQTFYLWLFYAGGNLIASVIPFPIPGNVVGMVLLFVALCLANGSDFPTSPGSCPRRTSWTIW
ncbi:MAG: CidA/LrgA family protein [Selenomonadales bacterium]|nr:CidA/LrgA family protein [Selenomonadales bacterium]